MFSLEGSTEPPLDPPQQPVVSEESYVVFAVFLAEVVQEEKTDKLTHFRSVEAAHSYVEHVAVVFLGPGGLAVR